MNIFFIQVYAVETTQQFADKLTSVIIQPLINILAIACVVVFVWGLVVFLSNFDSPEVASEGKRYIFIGLIGLFLIFAAKGIVSVIDDGGNKLLTSDISNVIYI